MEDSWKMTHFSACFASLSPNNEGLLSNDNNNDTAKHYVSGRTAHLFLRMYTRVFAYSHFVYSMLAYGSPSSSFYRCSSLDFFIVS